MIINKITLENIRSFEECEVEFKKGSTLLAGDIGSGKTSILLGIEFGLFGLQPGQKGSSLLRNGEDFGKVILEFTIEDKKIIVERTLKRGKTVSQDYCSIIIDDEKEVLAVTELKQRVLSLLNYPSEFSKKQNILYKFTVYTPQEEMKQIIIEDPETRINTLRHVFGIDKYKTILENTNLLRLKFREEKKLLEGITQNLENEKLALEKKEKEILEKKDSTINLTSDLLLKIEKRKNKEDELKNLNEKIEEKNRFKEELGKTKIMFGSKEELEINNQKQIKEIELEIQEFVDLKIEEGQEIKIMEFIQSRKNQKEKLNEISLAINGEISISRIKITETKNLQAKMSDLKVCPTCYQDVDAVYRANVLNKAHNDLSHHTKRIEELEVEKNSISEKRLLIKKEIEIKEKELRDLEILKMRLKTVQEKQIKLVALKENTNVIEKDLILLKEHLSSLNDSLLKFSKYDAIVDEKNDELKIAYREERMAEIKLAETKKEIEMFGKIIIEQKEKIEKTEEIQLQLDYLTELEMWLNKKFTPLVSFIERNVMISVKQEFSKLFSDWFNVLVPDNFSVRLSDNFTPIIEQQDYEIDYNYLSGGERTAIALSYRLALNQVINSLMSKIQTRELVILDEPTDGFSHEQLDKIREVLDELKAKQLIIVSHEQKIEGFVENVIKFSKEYGISKKD